MNVVTPITLKKNENRRGIMGLFSKKPSPQSAKMISLLNGEVARKSFDVKKSKRGKGVFHVTNYRIIFETLKDGVYISPDWYHLRSVHAIKKDKILIVWDDDNGRRWRFELKFGIPAEQVVQEAETANIEWSRDHDMTEEQARKEFNKRKGILVDNEISKDEAKKIRENRIKIFSEKADNLKPKIKSLEKQLDDSKGQKEKLKVLTKIGELRNNQILYQSIADSGKEKIPMFHDPRVPQNIPKENVWNDCYYDENWKGFVTFNEEYIKNGKTLRESEINKKFQKEINNGGMIISEQFVIFIQSYPAKINSKGTKFLIPTIKQEMITKQLENLYQNHIYFDKEK